MNATPPGTPAAPPPGDESFRPPLPTGWRRRAARLPLALYAAGLGRILGRRLLVLHHTGRTTGLDRRVTLEVVAYDRTRGSWTVASGFGPKAAWYRNLRHTPAALVEFSGRRFAVTAHFLPAGEGAELMARYAPQHPRLARRLCAFMGFEVDGSTESFRAAGARIPFVRLDAAPGQRLP
jgi:deazaflavin-dependent oxidoreductase (nitroreductase family)